MAVFARALPVIPLGTPVALRPADPSRLSAAATIASIERAVGLVRGGVAAAVVTNPIAKSCSTASASNIRATRNSWPRLAAPQGEAPPRPVMLLWCDALAVVPVTIHVPLRDVPRLLTRDLIVETGRIVARDFKHRFGVAKPHWRSPV